MAPIDIQQKASKKLRPSIFVNLDVGLFFVVGFSTPKKVSSC